MESYQVGTGRFTNGTTMLDTVFQQSYLSFFSPTYQAGLSEEKTIRKDEQGCYRILRIRKPVPILDKNGNIIWE